LSGRHTGNSIAPQQALAERKTDMGPQRKSTASDGWSGTASRGTVGALVVAMLAVLLALPGGTAAISGSDIYVTTTAQDGADGCSLSEAILSANSDSAIGDCTAGSSAGVDTIILAPFATYTMADIFTDGTYGNTVGSFVGPAATPMVTSDIAIDGLGATLVHAPNGVNFRAFSVVDAGSLTIRELKLKGFTVKGGNGAGGGGGGLGAGGAIYVRGGSLNVQQSTFDGNGAVGGNGSHNGPTVAGGGGGGLAGNGGAPFSAAFAGGGGGGGARGNGGRGDVDNFAGGAGGGGGGTIEDGESGDDNADLGTGKLQGGLDCGGDGGSTDIGFGGDDGEPGQCRGGGGGGGESYRPIIGATVNGNGGDGNYGGGGGGAGYDLGDGGDGGFGGGGGSGTTYGSTLAGFGPVGGNGGFGGGGGAGHGGFISGGPGDGGTFAGDADVENGGGGAALGGAIFGDHATIEVHNSTFTRNFVSRGVAGGGSAHNGSDAGGAIFLVAGSLTVSNATISGNEATGAGGGVVAYRPTTGDATAFVLKNTIVFGNGAKECYYRNSSGGSVSTTGSGGNLVGQTTGLASPDVPCPGIVSTADPDLQPLALNLPGRTETMALPLTSPAVDAVTDGEQVDQHLVLRPQGAGYDIGAFEAVDFPPTTTITLTPAAPDGLNGWYVSGVGVSISATDPDGTVAETRCALDPASTPATFGDLPGGTCPLTSVVTEGEHTIYAASVDANGNEESPLVNAALKLDFTDPILAPTLSSTVVSVGQTGVTASPNATDATSGVASSSCGAIDTSTAGDHTVTCTATDNAGNSASADLHYTVQYVILGFFSPAPVSHWKAGQTVPIKFALAYGDSTRIGDAEAAALARACRVTFSASGAQTKAASCAEYDAKKNQFVYSWKLSKTGTGVATIAVTVSYGGTTTSTMLSEVITITR
jgi:hypothetical protein